jgi:hypothetical protein
MKTRTGFVSNSSSSSFCIMGTVISKKEYKKLLSDKKAKKLSLRKVWESNVYWVGIDVEGMKSTETLDDFRRRAAIEFTKFGIVGSPEWICDDADQDTDYLGEDEDGNDE